MPLSLPHPKAHHVPPNTQSIFSDPCSLRDLNPARRQLTVKRKAGSLRGDPGLMCSLVVWEVLDQCNYKQ